MHRTLITDCKQLVIPMVNEVFNEDYNGTEEVILVQNEIFMHQEDLTEKRIQDASFIIVAESGKRKWYHLECQSTIDGHMMLRMYEYDSQSAIQNAVSTADGMEITFPHSAIVYLRHNAMTPDSMWMVLHTPGGRISYEVPIIKAQTYSVDEIFEKELYYLIPFHIFVYEKDFPIYESDSSKLEELEEIFGNLRTRLEECCLKGHLDEFAKTIILDMSRKVIRNIAAKYATVRKGVESIMGGQVLMHQAKYWTNKGISQGISQGISLGIAQNCAEIFKKMVSRGYSVEEAQELTGLEDKAVEEIMQMGK